jgi:ABC-type glutathione transport system ATPase component
MAARSDNKASKTAKSEKKDRTPLISMRNIKKSFGSVHALQGASIEVCPGEIVALVGDNGAGNPHSSRSWQACTATIPESTISKASRPISRLPRTPTTSASKQYIRIWRSATIWMRCRTCSSAGS